MHVSHGLGRPPARPLPRRPSQRRQAPHRLHRQLPQRQNCPLCRRLRPGTNYEAPWYLDADRKFSDIRTPEQTVRSLLKGHDHDEILSLAAPRPLLIIGGNDKKHSDTATTLPLIEKAKQTYRARNAEGNLQFHLLDTGHTPVHPKIDPLWQAFFHQFLRGKA
jgi:hypothetical protein